MTLTEGKGSATERPGAVLAALIAVQVLFGMNYVISKIVVHAFPPLVWASIRIAIASAIMLAICYFSRRPMPKLDRAYLVPMIGYALLGTTINQVCFLVGLRYTTSTNSAVLNTLIPVVTLAIVTIRGQEKLTWNRALGFLLAFAGVLAIRKIEDIRFSDQTFIGDLLTVANCVSYGIFLSVSRPFFVKHDAMWTTAFLFLYGTVFVTLAALPQYVGFHWPEWHPELVRSALFAVLGGTLATYFLNFWALRRARSSHVALFIYIQPIVASFIAWGWYHERITLRTACASLLIFMGMVCALLRREEGKAA